MTLFLRQVSTNFLHGFKMINESLILPTERSCIQVIQHSYLLFMAPLFLSDNRSTTENLKEKILDFHNSDINTRA